MCEQYLVVAVKLVYSIIHALVALATCCASAPAATHIGMNGTSNQKYCSVSDSLLGAA
jgi:hypothetical protein